MIDPYYTDDHVTIYHGDCLEILPHLSEVNLVFTSPPYNLGVNANGGTGMHAGSLAASDLAGGYGSHDDAMPPNEYDAWQTELVTSCWNTLTDDGAIFYNHKPRPWAGELKLPIIYGRDLPLRQIITWDRGTGMNFSESHFLPKSEWIMIWAKPEWRLIDRKTSGIGDVWRIAPETASVHPAPFPIHLPSTAIAATGADMVLDPFMGSGTTLRAAKNFGRKAIGIELEERYCEIAANRMAQEVLPI